MTSRCCGEYRTTERQPLPPTRDGKNASARRVYQTFRGFMEEGRTGSSKKARKREGSYVMFVACVIT